MAFSNNVIGPYSSTDWNVMLTSKQAIAYMIETDPEFYREAIRKERTNLKQDFFCRIAA